MSGGYVSEWHEMELWPVIWDADFGFSPIGVHKVEPSLLWYFNNKCITQKERNDWSEVEMHKLYVVQIAAAVSRVMRLDFTLQLRGKNVWVHRPILEDSVSRISKTFDTEDLLIRNLARMSEWLLGNDFVPRIVETDGTSNLHMLLGKFDIA